MCGVSGFVGVKNSKARLHLAYALGVGIDRRGGHAAGYVNVYDNFVRFNRKLGEWTDARLRFIRSAAQGDISMMHARYATCGKRTVEEAHPFAIKRKGQMVLWGAHNGMIPNAWGSAKKNNREISVDSQEIFELLADEDYDGLNALEGYGVITWIEYNDINSVKFARLSSNSDFHIVALKEGGYVWGSTSTIVESAVKHAGLTINNPFDCKEVGLVYQVTRDGVFETEQKNVKIGCKKYSSQGYSSSYWSNHYNDDWESEFDKKDSATKSSASSKLVKSDIESADFEDDKLNGVQMASMAELEQAYADWEAEQEAEEKKKS